MLTAQDESSVRARANAERDDPSSTSAVESELARSSVVALFGRGIENLPDDPVGQCLSICRTYNLSPDDLYYKWEAFAATSSGKDAASSDQLTKQPTRANLERLRLDIAKDAERGKLGKSDGNVAASATTASIQPRQSAQRLKRTQLQDDFHDKDSLVALLHEFGMSETPGSGARGNFSSPPSGNYSATTRPQIRGAPGKGMATPKRIHQDGFPGSSPLSRTASGMAPVGKLKFEEVDSPSRRSPAGVKFADRTNKNKSEDVLNSHLPAVLRRDKRPSRSKITLARKQQMDPYRYMFEKISEKSEVLDERINRFADIIQDSYSVPEIAHPGYPYQTIVTTVGRICCDSEGFMNLQSIVLESSRALGSGCRVKLDLSGIPSFLVFPGQIVGVEGMNASGNSFVATKLLEIPLLPMASSTPKELFEIYYESRTEKNDPSAAFLKSAAESSILIAVVAGPYTLEHNLEFEPLADLLKEMESARPDVLLLMGPFVSEDHQLVQKGDLDLPPAELFRSTVSALISEFCEACPSTTVVLIPSCKDVISPWCAMPQPPLGSKSCEGQQDLEAREEDVLGLPSDVVCLPNPAQFWINETLFAVSPTDILFHLSSEVKGRSPTPSDRLGRLARHVLEQRSFYPLYPPALGEGLVDFSRLEQLELQAMPDVLILGSRMKYFAKVVEDVVVINPGHLTKMQSGGTYAMMTIHPPRESDLRALMTDASGGRSSENAKMEIDAPTGGEGDAPRGAADREQVRVRHDVAGRARVEIRRV